MFHVWWWLHGAIWRDVESIVMGFETWLERFGDGVSQLGVVMLEMFLEGFEKGLCGW